MILEIKYKDKASWQTISGDVIEWVNYSNKYKNERIQPYYVAPDIIKDVWNAIEHDVQHVSWTSYYFELFITESEIDFARQLKSCSDIKIAQYSEDSDGKIVKTTYENIDLISADYFEISEPERMADTSGWKLSVIFRTERTTIDKSLPIDSTYEIAFNTANSAWSLKDALSTDLAPGSERLRFDYFSDTKIITYSSNGLATYQLIGNQWTRVTPFTSSVPDGVPAVMTDTTVAVAGSDGSLEMYELIDNKWTKKGATFSTGLITDGIARLTDTRIAYTGQNSLIAYGFDGKEWSIRGNAASVGLQGGDIAAIDSDTIVAISFLDSQLIGYDFNGTDWVPGGTFAYGSNTYGSISASGGNVAVVDDTNDQVRTYSYNGTWTDLSVTYSISPSNQPVIGHPAYNKVIILDQDSDITRLERDTKAYYTDFEPLDYDLPVENILYNWIGESDIIIQSVSKTGKEALIYLDDASYTQFIKDINAYKQCIIGGVTVGYLSYESSIIADGIWRLVLRGIPASGRVVTSKGAPTTTTNSLVVNSATYYSDFDIKIGVAPVEEIFIDWHDGSRKLAQSHYKKTQSILLFFNQADGSTFESNYYQGQIKTINGIDTQDCTIEIQEIAENYKAYVITGVITDTVTTHNVSPSNTYNITIDGTPYYTDYLPQLISEAPIINTVENQTGVNTSTKTITKEVKQYKFYLNETNAFALKDAFESKSTTKTADGSNVLEDREVSPEKIGLDNNLYEVVVNCLLSTTDV
jgi:hypothetical protein